MKARNCLLIVALAFPLLLCAQNTTPETPATPQTQTQSGTMHRGMKNSQGGADMRAMHEQHMQEMKQNIAKMKTLLEQMKTNAAGLSGKDKAAMDANVQLWQMMIDHMDQMMNHMGMMGSGMNGRGMKHNHGAPPPPPPPPAPQQ
jgi:hypothetical protein